MGIIFTGGTVTGAAIVKEFLSIFTGLVKILKAIIVGFFKLTKKAVVGGAKLMARLLALTADELAKFFDEIFQAIKKYFDDLGKGAEKVASKNVAGASKKIFSLWKVNFKKGNYNCANCALAVDKTLAGYPTSAVPWTYIEKLRNGKLVKEISYTAGTNLKILELEYGRKFILNTTPNKISKMLVSGQRGIVYGYKNGNQMGHVFNVVKERGVVRFLDGQKIVRNSNDTQKADLIYDVYHFLPTNF